MAVTTAVVPAAGRGTRLRPATLALPKPLLPLVDRPVAQWVVDELRAAGMERIVLVVGPGGEALERHFAGEVGLVVVRQPEPRGLGDAVACAEDAVEGEPFAVALGDSLLRPGRVVGELVSAFEERGPAAVVAVEEVGEEVARRRGVVVPAEDGDRFAVADLVEKPAEPLSRLAVAARYVLAPAVFDALRDTSPGADGEIQLTDAIRRLAPVVGVRLPAGERRFDVGWIDSYCAAFVEWALTDPERGERVRRLVDADVLG